MKRNRILSATLLQAAVCVAALSFSTAAMALTQQTPAMSIEQMTKSADEIVMGNVVGQNTRIVANSFETDYQIQVYENLKTRSGALVPGETFTLTLPGGSLQEPPLTQYVMGQPYMYKGEEVMLFLQQGSGREVRLPARSVAAGEVSRLTTSYKVVGLNQGRFDIVTMNDGDKMVTRLNMENYGITSTGPELRQVIQGIAQERIPTVVQQIAREQDAAADVHDKDPLEFTAADGKKVKVEQTLQKADAMKTLRQRAPIVQDLDSFKAQVKAFAVQSN